MKRNTPRTGKPEIHALNKHERLYACTCLCRCLGVLCMIVFAFISLGLRVCLLRTKTRTCSHLHVYPCTHTHVCTLTYTHTYTYKQVLSQKYQELNDLFMDARSVLKGMKEVIPSSKVAYQTTEKVDFKVCVCGGHMLYWLERVYRDYVKRIITNAIVCVFVYTYVYFLYPYVRVYVCMLWVAIGCKTAMQQAVYRGKDACRIVTEALCGLYEEHILHITSIFSSAS